MSRLETTYRRWGHVKVAGALISGVAIFLMMLLTIADAFSRNFLGGSISGTFEIVQSYFMPLAVFPGLAYVYGSGMLPRMSSLIKRCPKRVQDWTIYVLLVLELIVFSLLVYYTWGYALDGMDRGVAFPAGGSLYTLWPLLFVVPIGLMMVVVETVFVAVANISNESVSMTIESRSESH